MKTVTLVSEKGGVGKSTIAMELYYHYKRAHKNCSMLSLDPQYENASIRESNPSVVVIDTPGVLDKALKGVIQRSDAIIIPTRPTPKDAEPFYRTLSNVRSVTNAPVLVAVNGYNSFIMTQRFMEWLLKIVDKDDIAVIPQSEAIVQSMATNHSVYGHDRYGKATEYLLSLCGKVDDLLDITYDTAKYGVDVDSNI